MEKKEKNEVVGVKSFKKTDPSKAISTHNLVPADEDMTPELVKQSVEKIQGK